MLLPAARFAGCAAARATIASSVDCAAQEPCGQVAARSDRDSLAAGQAARGLAARRQQLHAARVQPDLPGE
jgi:hypothetical protein